MDGERDPRDLIICFQCIQLIVKHLEFGKRGKTFFSSKICVLDPFKEELFEVVACYFPLEQKSVGKFSFSIDKLENVFSSTKRKRKIQKTKKR